MIVPPFLLFMPKSTLKTLCFLFVFCKVIAQDENENFNFETHLFTNFSEARRYAIEDLRKNKQANDDLLLLKSYSNLSEICFFQKENDSSLMYANTALAYAHKFKSKIEQAKLYNRLGALKIREGNYNDALIKFENALALAKSTNSYKTQSEIINNVALLYRIRGDGENAVRELEKSIKISQNYNNQNALARSYNILGLIHYNIKKESSIYYYKEAIQLTKKCKNNYLYGIVLSNLGDLYLNMKEYDFALKNLIESEQVALSVGNKATLYFINLSLGIYYEEIDDYPKAIEKYEKALTNYQTYVGELQKLRVYWLLSGAYYHNKAFEKAFEIQEQYIDLNEELQNAKKAKEFDEIRTQFEVEKKDTKIILLKNENELAATKRKWIITSALLITIPLIGLFLFYRHRTKTLRTIRLQENALHTKEKETLKKEQELLKIKALIEGQNKERNRIAKELHDGVGGQLASVNLSLSHINSNLKSPEIQRLNTTLSNTFSELRTLSHRLSSNYLKGKSFEILMCDLKNLYENSGSFDIEISVYPEDCLKEIHSILKHNLYRILQELITNSLKHAAAKRVQMSFNLHTNLLIVMFEDDGKGFDVKSTKNGIGLKNIKERIALINSTMTIDSTLNKGTHICIEIPLIN